VGNAEAGNAERLARRIAIASMAISALLALLKISVGLRGHSAAVVSDGVESASDVLASGIVLIGLSLASKPPDEDHPYGHGRFETLSGLAVGLILTITGTAICFRALENASQTHAPALFTIWPLIASTLVKGGMSAAKFRTGRKIGSESLIADGWNDTVDILSGLVALSAVSLSIWLPGTFNAADHYGAVAVGMIVIFLGVRVIFETAKQLTDTMPDEKHLEDIRRVALRVPGALAIEKCFARKTGLRFHVDLHLEVDPDLTVRDSHLLGHQVRTAILSELDWVADVLVHVEPHAADTIETRPQWRTGK
jgi:cation diffusion facilitator family transporter